MNLLACLLVLNGLRVSEAVGVKLGDIGSVRGHRTLTVDRKGGRRTTFPLAPRTIEALDAWLVHRNTLRTVSTGPEDPLLLDDYAQPLSRFQAYRLVRRIARQAGITQPISPHSLRHTFVTLSLDAGVPLRDVQDAAGHADPRTTRRYDRARYSLDRHTTHAPVRYLE